MAVAKAPIQAPDVTIPISPEQEAQGMALGTMVEVTIRGTVSALGVDDSEKPNSLGIKPLEVSVYPVDVQDGAPSGPGPIPAAPDAGSVAGPGAGMTPEQMAVVMSGEV